MTAGPATPAKIPEATRLYELGRGMARGGDSVRAEHYLNAAMQAGYPRSEVLPRLLDVCIRGSRLRSALNYALPALDQQPDDHQLRTLAASLYLGLGQPDKAREALNTVLTMAPEMAQAHYLLATTSWEAFGDSESARLHFERYLELAPEGKRTKNARLWLVRHPAGPQPRPAEVSADVQPTPAPSAPKGLTPTAPMTRNEAPAPASESSSSGRGGGREASEPLTKRASPLPPVQGMH